jgi:hypothetical protein
MWRKSTLVLTDTLVRNCKFQTRLIIKNEKPNPTVQCQITQISDYWISIWDSDLRNQDNNNSIEITIYSKFKSRLHLNK